MDKVAFLGLGIMGRHMALNVAKGGFDLTVWNRSAPATEDLAQAGARVAASPAEAVADADIVLMMLRNKDVIDTVLSRDDADTFKAMVDGKIVVHLGTTLVPYSRGLGEAVVAAGGLYVEAPVSGSSVPAANGTLVGMLAGDADTLDRVEPVIRTMCASVERCGAVPSATAMKLAVNTYLCGLVYGLIEGMALATKSGLDLDQYARILEAGPMANPLMSMKLPKLIARDFDGVQGALRDSHYNFDVILNAAEDAGLALPVVAHARETAARAMEQGLSDKDFSAAFEMYLNQS